MQRPLFVTIIAWFLILSAMMNVITSTLLFDNPLAELLLANSIVPLDAVRFVILNLLSALSIVCGAGLLFRQRWSRGLFIVLAGLTSLLTLIIVPLAVVFIPLLLVFIGTSVYLFDPRVAPYFAAPPPPREVERPLRSFKQQIAGKPCGTCGDKLLMSVDGFECANCSTVFCCRCETPDTCGRCRRESVKADERAR